jgi:hypothetical protein
MITVILAIWGTVTGTLAVLLRLSDWWEERRAEQLECDFEGEAHWREPDMMLHVRFCNRSNTPKTVERAALEFGPPDDRRRASAAYESDMAHIVEPNTPVRYGELRDKYLVLPLVVPKQDVKRGPLPFRFWDDDHKAWTAATRKDRRVLTVSYDGKELQIEWPRAP